MPTIIDIKEIQQNPLRSLKVHPRIWTALRELKKPTESVGDLIEKSLIYMAEKEKIEFSLTEEKKRIFFEDKSGIGYECCYNNLKLEKNKKDYTLDLTFQIFDKRRRFNPSQFFNLKSKNFFVSDQYTKLHLKAILLIFNKEFKIDSPFENESQLFDKIIWESFYKENNLSMISLKHDVLDKFESVENVKRK